MPTKAKLPIPANIPLDRSACFTFQIPDDVEWIGMLFGAVYQLGVWDSYDRDDAHTAKDVADVWKDIIEKAHEGPCGAAPEFYLAENSINCEYTSTLDLFRAINTCDGFDHVYYIHAKEDSIALVTKAGWSCLNLVDDTGVGGHICNVHAFVDSGNASPVWVLTWRDCLNVDHEVSYANDDPEFIHSDFECIWACLQVTTSGLLATDQMTVVVSIDGPILCTAA